MRRARSLAYALLLAGALGCDGPGGEAPFGVDLVGRWIDSLTACP